jgi:16S rRNA (cytosine967-C5)-methyltransferase
LGRPRTSSASLSPSPPPRTTPRPLPLAERIILGSDRAHPADAVLRETLKAHRQLSPADRASISQAVFTFYRWRRWLDEHKPLRDRIETALKLAERFAARPESFSDDELLARAVPAWLKQVMHVTPAWLQTLQTPPKLWLRARRGQGRGIARELGDCQPFGQGSLADTLEYCGHQDLFLTPAFHTGRFELQDLSSQAIGLICAPAPGQTWWDACAGEGGKVLHLSDLMENKGLIWASDSAPWRLQKLKRRAARSRVFNYRAAPWDGGPKLPTKTKFDGVLVDAPCSGIGTWQRNPHARWTVTAEDIRELSVLQTRLLAHAAPAVKPGGRLIYAVCTSAQAETRGVVAAFQEQFPGFSALAFFNPLATSAEPAAELQYWPQNHGGAGMFVAGWSRVS